MTQTAVELIATDFCRIASRKAVNFHVRRTIVTFNKAAAVAVADWGEIPPVGLCYKDGAKKWVMPIMGEGRDPEHFGPQEYAGFYNGGSSRGGSERGPRLIYNIYQYTTQKIPKIQRGNLKPPRPLGLGLRQCSGILFEWQYMICKLLQSQIWSLVFVVDPFFIKLFKTNNVNIVSACQDNFSSHLPCMLLAKRVAELASNFSLFCRFFLISYCCVLRPYFGEWFFSL